MTGGCSGEKRLASPRQKRLPEALSEDQVRRLLGSIRNPVHKTCLAVMYACGLAPRDCDREYLGIVPDGPKQPHRARQEASRVGWRDQGGGTLGKRLEFRLAGGAGIVGGLEGQDGHARLVGRVSDPDIYRGEREARADAECPRHRLLLRPLDDLFSDSELAWRIRSSTPCTPAAAALSSRSNSSKMTGNASELSVWATQVATVGQFRVLAGLSR